MLITLLDDKCLGQAAELLAHDCNYTTVILLLVAYPLSG